MVTCVKNEQQGVLTEFTARSFSTPYVPAGIFLLYMKFAWPFLHEAEMKTCLHFLQYLRRNYTSGSTPELTSGMHSRAPYITHRGGFPSDFFSSFLELACFSFLAACCSFQLSFLRLIGAGVDSCGAWLAAAVALAGVAA